VGGGNVVYSSGGGSDTPRQSTDYMKVEAKRPRNQETKKFRNSEIHKSQNVEIDIRNRLNAE
jgi:hypothetical protein